MFDTYERFIQERHAIWVRRAAGSPAPWTDDEILRTVKFTNMFRVLDPGSQYAVRMLNDTDDPETVVLRAFMYRLTNSTIFWDFYRDQVGRWAEIRDLYDGTLDEVLTSARIRRVETFGSAYIISPGAINRGLNRHQWLAKVTRDAFTPGGDYELDRDVFTSDSVERRVKVLTEVPRVGSFLALQIATDIGYSDALPSDENEFVTTGPGSERGLMALGAPPVADSIRHVHREICSTVSLDVHGTPRHLSLMDVQNSLCEFNKYQRNLLDISRRVRHYKPSEAETSAVHTNPTYPTHWS